MARYTNRGAPIAFRYVKRATNPPLIRKETAMIKNISAWMLAALLILALNGDMTRPKTPSFAAQATSAAPERLSDVCARLPLFFEANTGQADSQFQFIAHGAGFGLFLGSAESALEMRLPRASSAARLNPLGGTSSGVGEAPPVVVRLKLEGANPIPKISGMDRLPTRVNYLIGSEPAKWLTNVPVYSRVKYDAVYPGVDLICYGSGQQIEYDFLVTPGAEVNKIELAFDGVDKIELDSGDLVLGTAGGIVRQHRPVIYQEHGGTRHDVAGHYVLIDENRVGFSVGDYDTHQPLVIDPVLEYSTYFGGNGDENLYSRSDLNGAAIAVDAAGNAYFAGNTTSTDLRTENALQPGMAGAPDAFVAKLNAAGSALVYCTYLGGSGIDRAFGIAVDSEGSAYVTGRTQSPNFPMVHPLQSGLRGVEDAFVAKLSAEGSSLIYSTFLGGSAGDDAHGIAVDAEHSVYVVGGTFSTDFPVRNALQSAYGGGAVDAFVAKLNPSGSQLVYATYLGGSGDDHPEGVAVNAAGEAYVAGQTTSANFPTVNPFQSTLGGPLDAFVARFNASGTALIYSTYLGGGGLDAASSIAVDAAGNAYIAGVTASTDFPTAGALQAALSGSLDAFVAKLNPAGSSLGYSSYLGGNGNEVAYSIAVDSFSCAYIAGATTSVNFPTADAQQAFLFGVQDAFVTKLNDTGSAMDYSTYIGGEAIEDSNGIAVGHDGSAYVIGRTNSFAFPTLNPMQASRGGGQVDAFVTKIAGSQSVPDAPKINGVIKNGKKLFVTGEKFDAGAKILINGEQQKTTNDADNPTASLVGKKAGKFVSPGDRIQVRNSSGALSAEFIFSPS